MASLGSVLEPDDKGPKGPDLRVAVDVPRAALGLPEGILLEVPEELEADDGALHARARSPYDDGNELHLHLPEGFPDGGVLRLRGQGAVGSDQPGDLLVKVTLVAGALPHAQPNASGSWVRWAVVGSLAAAAAGLIWALASQA